MAYIMSKFRVSDFAEWKAGFGSPDGCELRRKGGMQSYQIFQVEGDPNNVVMIAQFPDTDTARQFIQSAELRQKHERTGAGSEPTATFLREVEKRDV